MPNHQAVTRRRFLTGLGATTVVTAAGGLSVAMWRRNPGDTAPVGSAEAPTPGTFGAASGERTLVVVELGGGNDGLNTVIPYANPIYHDRRPTMAVEEPIELDDEIGLHRSLSFLADEYGAGRLAIVEGVGYPNPNLSHFESLATWWTGGTDADDYTGDAGWLGRMLDGTVGYEDPLAGIVVGPGPSQALLGQASFVVSIQDERGLQPDLPPWIDNADELLGAWSGFAPAEELNGGDTVTLVQRSLGVTAEARDDLAAALAGEPQEGAVGGFGSQMSTAARLITSGLAPQVIYVHGFSDFDTHSNQGNRHSAELAQVDEGMRVFFSALEQAGRSDQAVVVTMSEFGRRLQDNGSGTDHGTASVLLVAGAPVTGGRFGEQPSLATLDETSNLIHTVDFRSVYATVLDSWLEVDADGILGRSYERLGFL